ncbi:MAG: hypothetical protein E7170_00845 [Firmicutes bacterium]|nr:hypothetical protein [Bacillota bacterium]
MEKIINVMEYNYDCSTNHFYFINDDGIVCFYQALNCDLVFSIYSFKNISEVDFVISKTEFRKVYDLINDMLNEMHFRKDTLEYMELFEKGYFSWKSDAPANEEAWASNNDFVYNYLNIIEIESAYKLKFINNTNNPRFCVEINTDRSRYGRMRFNIWDLYKNLENVCHKENKAVLEDDIKQLALKYKIR